MLNGQMDIINNLVPDRGESKEGDGKNREAGGHNLPSPGPGHGVPIADCCHSDLKYEKISDLEISLIQSLDTRRVFIKFLNLCKHHSPPPTTRRQRSC